MFPQTVVFGVLMLIDSGSTLGEVQEVVVAVGQPVVDVSGVLSPITGGSSLAGGPVKTRSPTESESPRSSSHPCLSPKSLVLSLRQSQTRRGSVRRRDRQESPNDLPPYTGKVKRLLF